MVKINNQFSDPNKVRIDIPQGTYIIYMNSLLTEISIHGPLLSYTNDTVLIVNGSSWEEVKEIAEKKFSKVCTWMNNLQLTTNVEKTKYVPYSLADIGDGELISVR